MIVAVPFAFVALVMLGLLGLAARPRTAHPLRHPHHGFAC